MKKIHYSLILCFFFSSAAVSQNPPLRIAVAYSKPPYTMQGGGKQVFGFDAMMMEWICAAIKRDCVFDPLQFSELMPAILSNKSAVAVGAIAITVERAKLVNFSIPYLPSEFLFLGKAELAKSPFDLQSMSEKRIGIIKGSAFYHEIFRLGIKNPTITEYRDEGDLMEALASGEVDVVILDAPAVRFWEMHSSGMFKALGQPTPYANGLGIAVNSMDVVLLDAINAAIKKYQKSPDFKKNYDAYFMN